MELWGKDDVQFRPYGGLAHSLGIGTFFGGMPETDPADGSPQTQTLYFKDFVFAGARS
jgi:hypothetical protein